MRSVITDVAVAQAVGLCWLARRSGLPGIDSLRVAVAQLHATPCGWCDYPLPVLIDMLEDAEILPAAEKSFWSLPGRTRLRLIERAADRESVA